MPMIGAVICPIAFFAASFGGSLSCSMMCSTFSTTTIASSTTMPMASTSASSDTVLAEKPSTSRTAKVPIKETGTATIGISVARKLPRNRKTTIETKAKASSSVLITSWIVAVTKTVVS